MKVKINGQEYKLPASLAAVILQQRIDFDKQYGKALRKELAKILDIKDERVRDIEFTVYHCRIACESLSFFAGIPLDVVNNTATEDVLTIYHQVMKGYAEDYNWQEKEFDLKNEFGWKDEMWVVAPPELQHDSKMTFGELITAKQTVQNMMELGDEKWEALLPLCCIYFRKKGEAFKEEFLAENGERYQMMKTLPLEYALHVAFFLKGSQHSWLNTFQSSRKAEGQEPAET
jgi:hypothetical protein